MNIFLTFNDSIRIGDLGVAKQLEPNKSHAHAQVGTPYYMSPEILQDIPYNEKSDVWSLGCVLYQLATFKRPFEAPNGMSLAFKIQKAQYVPLSNIYSPALHRLIENCLTKDHLKRKSIAELLEDPGGRGTKLASCLRYFYVSNKNCLLRGGFEEQTSRSQVGRFTQVIFGCH